MSAAAIPNFEDFKKQPLTVGNTIPSFDDFKAKTTSAEHAATYRETLGNQGFLDSAWQMIKSPFSVVSSVLSGQEAESHNADIQRVKELQQNGTDDQKREFAKDYLLRAIPGASTIYKAAQGNIPGALGDIAGVVTLGAIAKGATSDTVGDVAAATKAGVKMGAPKVAGGAAIIGAAEAAGKLPGMAWPARIGAAYPAGRMLVEGGKSGFEAARSEMAARAAARESAIPVNRTPIWAGTEKVPTTELPDVNPIASTLPSGRVPGSGVP